MSNNNIQHQQAKLLRGGSFVQPNTAAAPAVVLQDVTLHAEDLHVYTRTSTIMLRPTILKWRAALIDVADDISKETKKPVNQIRSAPPDTIQVIDFKPPPPVTFKGIHRVDGDLKFEWQDRDAALGGVYQPKIVVNNNDNNHENNNNNNANKNQSNGGEAEIDYSLHSRKLWQSHELSKTDKVAWELLRQHWKDMGRKAKEELQQKSLLLSNGGGGSSTSAISGVRITNNNNNNHNNNSNNQTQKGNIRQRTEDVVVDANNTKNINATEMKQPANSAALSSNKASAAVAPSTTTVIAGGDDLDAILRRAQEALGL